VKNLLFICSRNQWRSPTAETIWKNSPDFNVRSAGVSPKARKTVSPTDIQWADVIFVMEKKHRSRLIARFTRLLDYKTIHILDIPDDYQYMDAALIEALEVNVDAYFNQ
jgi:predicted protein tyrosine phosphatase